MSRRHHHHIQPYDYDRFSEHIRDRDRDRDQARGIEYQDDSLSSINSDEETYIHQRTTKEKSNFLNKNEPASKTPKVDKSSNSESYHQKEIKVQTTNESDATSQRLTRLESMLEELIKRSNPPPPPPLETPMVSLPEKPPSDRRGQFSLEPRRHDFTTSMWINKIQEVSIQNNWDEKTTISFMGSQMSGIIKAWYNNLPHYDYTWPEWKLLIAKMFPDNTDFVTSLKRLVTRLKQADESMSTYYFSKMYLIEACKITGEDAVSCLIDGLNNHSIQEEAKAQNFLTPETLYSQFLTVLPEYTVDYAPTIVPTSETVLSNWYYHEEQPHEQIESEAAVVDDTFEYEKDVREEEFGYHSETAQSFRGNEEIRPVKTSPKRSAPVHSRLDKRFIRSSNFKHQKIPMAAKVCSICFNRGHLARNCRKADKILCCKFDQVKHDSRFYKDCTINGRKFKSFIDTGCTTVTIREKEAQSLDLNLELTSNLLETYGGGMFSTIGKAEVTISMDFVTTKLEVVVVPNHLQDVPVIIGQGLLSKKNIYAFLQKEGFNLFQAANKLTD